MTVPDYVPSPEATTEDTIIGLIEHLSAYIEQFHNGFVEVASFEDNVRIRGPLRKLCTVHEYTAWVDRGYSTPILPRR